MRNGEGLSEANEGGQKISGDYGQTDRQTETMGSEALQMQAPRKQSQPLQEPPKLERGILDISLARCHSQRGLL